MKINKVAVSVITSMAFFSVVAHAENIWSTATQAPNDASYQIKYYPVSKTQYSSLIQLNTGKIQDVDDFEQAPETHSQNPEWQVNGQLSSASFQRADENYTPWQVTTDAYLEIQDIRAQQSEGKRVYNKVMPAVRVFISNPNSKWRYAFEYSLAGRNLTHSFESMDSTHYRNRLEMNAARNVYQNLQASIDLGLTYRKESNDVKPGSPALSGYNAFALTPSGEFRFNDKIAFKFWDMFSYYDNQIASNHKRWESEHGFQYKFTEHASADLMFYTDWEWDSDGKIARQQQIRGYFPTQINQTWSILPYFRYFLSDKSFESSFERNRVIQRNDNGVRLGAVVNYNINPATILWMNLAYEKTKWDSPQPANMTRGDDNKQDLGLYSIGIRHFW